jgi:hypothetical protein
MLKTKPGSEFVEFGHHEIDFQRRVRRMAGRVIIEQIALVGMPLCGMCLALR